MTLHTLEQEQHLPITPEQAWHFFSNPANLNTITPPDLGFQITSPPETGIYDGQIITYRVKIAPLIHLPWITEIKCVDPGHAFIDEQRAGPYAFWHHRHTFTAAPGGTLMRDKIHYALPLGPLGTLAHTLYVRRKLQWIFRYRKQILTAYFTTPTAGPTHP